MSDLISRKALLETFEEYGFNQQTMIPTISLMKVLEIIDNQPTAYDVDKVAEILDKEAHMLYSLQAFEPVKAWRNEYLIPIVKAGGTVSLMDILKGAVKDE